MQYRPEIDGLRSLAVLPVVLFHAKIAGFQGGYVGVDIFFVISGYLITRILSSDMDRGTYSLLGFYERRARRILPALLVVMAVSTVIAWNVLPPLEMQWFGQSLIATALFVANIYFVYRGGNYFGGLTDEYPMLHTWSLAVEEQFYIIFPLLLWALWRLGKGRVILVIAAISVLSLAGAEVLSRINQPMNFYLLPTRVWELGAGAICALLHERAPRRQNQWMSLLGLVLIAGSVVALPADIRFPSLWAVPPVAGAALIILYAGPETWVGRLLSLRVLVAIGLASYSTYLWHQPLFAFAHVHADAYPGTAVMLGLAALSLALGFLSLRFVERPFRKRGGMSAARVVTLSGAALAAAAGVGLALHLSLGAAFRPAGPELPRNYFAQVAKPFFPDRGAGLQSCDDFCVVVAQEDPVRRVLLAGDSHAQDLILPLTDLAVREGWELTLFIDKGCSFTLLTGRCSDSTARLVRGARSYDEVILLNRFSGLPALKDTPDPERLAAAAMAEYATLIRALLSGGEQRVTLFAPRFMLDRDPVRTAMAGHLDEIRVREDFTATPAWQAFLRELRGLTGVEILDQNDILVAASCGAASCFNAHTGARQPLYRDGHHLSRVGGALLSERLDNRLAER